MSQLGFRTKQLAGVAAFTLGLAGPTVGIAHAQAVNTTQANVNVLNLLSPFLNLNATAVGQQTLSGTLSGALALNTFAAANPVVAAVSISDKTIDSGTSTSITLSNGTTRGYGAGANLAGGLPLQAVQTPGTIAPIQQYGGLGNLGAAFQAAVAPSGATAPAVATMLNAAYTFTSSDVGTAKNYFANGTVDGVSGAVAPAGVALPTANGYPNRRTSVYDTAYGVSNTGAGQNVYGDSRPVQVSTAFTAYDPTALSGLATNPAFPSGHTNYAFTDSILIGMLVPQYYQSMLLRASEYGQSRNELGVHYTLDIIGSRAYAAYDLAQLLNGAPGYTTTNAAGSTTALNLNAQFQAAAQQLTAYLQTQTASCGGSVAACAASNPYSTYSAATYAAQPFVTVTDPSTAGTNAAIYAGRMTQGLPTLSFAAAPREQAPAGAADASILLSTLYGGSTPAAQGLAASVGGPLYGNLSTGTINQIIVNTENNAFAAFYGSALSYWSRINLYAAAGYLQNVTGRFTLAPTDVVNTNLTVANTGVLSGSGRINGNLVVQSGGALATQGSGAQATAPLTVNGSVGLLAGSRVQLTGMFLPGVSYKLVSATGAIGVDPSVRVDTSLANGLLPAFGGTLVVAGDPGLSVRIQSNFAGFARTGNQAATAAALDAGGNAGNYGAGAAALLGSLIQTSTPASVPGVLATLSGEGLAGQQQASFTATELLASTVLDAARGGQTGTSIVQAGPRRVWATGLGQTASLDGSGSSGAGQWSATTAGFAAGTDYRLENGLTLGIAGGYTDSQFSVKDRATSGQAEAGHVAIYGLQRFGATYVTGVLDAGFFSNKTTRAGYGATQKGAFSATEVLGRVEAGRAYAFAPATVTPYAGFQVAGLFNSSLSEGGVGNGNLNVGSQSVGSQKVYLGVQADTARTFGAVTLVPYARLAWEHEFNVDRTINASFASLPATSFTVAGAPAARDAARLSTGAKLDLGNGVGLYAAFDGVFSGQGNSYAGKGGLRYSW